MVAISPHTTRATGTILTAVMYNGDHGNHITNAQALNAGKIEGVSPGSVVDGNLAVWDGIAGNAIRDGGAPAVPLSPPWDTADYSDDSVTYAKIQNVTAANRILGRITALAGDIEELTGTQATTLLDTFTDALKGLTPASGGGTANFLRADGTWAAPVSGDYRLLNSGTVSAAATLDIVLTAFTAYKDVELVLQNFTPVTNDRELWLRFSSNGGSSYDAANSNYTSRAIYRETSGGTVVGAQNSNANNIMLTSNGTSESVTNVVGDGGWTGIIQILNRTQTTMRTSATFHGHNRPVDGIIGGGQRTANQDTDAIRILFESGNIASGSWALYGRA